MNITILILSILVIILILLLIFSKLKEKSLSLLISDFSKNNKSAIFNVEKASKQVKLLQQKLLQDARINNGKVYAFFLKYGNDKNNLLEAIDYELSKIYIAELDKEGSKLHIYYQNILKSKIGNITFAEYLKNELHK